MATSRSDGRRFRAATSRACLFCLVVAGGLLGSGSAVAAAGTFPAVTDLTFGSSMNANSKPAWLDNSSLIYDGNGIWRFSLATRQTQQILSSARDYGNFQLSPNRDLLVTDDSGGGIAVVGVDGTGYRRVGFGSDSHFGIWKADGSRIVYAHLLSTSELRVVAPDGTGDAVVSSFPPYGVFSQSAMPSAYLSDGTIIFWTYSYSLSEYEIRSISEDGSSLSPPLAIGAQPQLSPDKSQMAFYATPSHTLMVSTISGAAQQHAVTTAPVQDFTWAPDGSGLYYCTTWSAPGLWWVSADGSSRRELSADACTAPSVSPDGSLIAVAHVTLDSSGMQRSTELAVISSDASVPTGVPPAVTVPKDMVVESASPSGMPVSFSASAVDSAGNDLPATCYPASGSIFPVGTTTVTCTATDAASSTGRATFHVAVIYGTVGTVTNESVTCSASSGGAGSYSFSNGTFNVSATAPGYCALELQFSGSTYGLWSVQWQALPAGSWETISGGMWGTSGGEGINLCYFLSSGLYDFRLNEQTSSGTEIGVSSVAPYPVQLTCGGAAPTLTLPANETVSATNPNGAVVSFSASATDSSGNSLATVCTPASGSLFPVGTTTVTCSATDSSQNTATGTFGVTVLPDTTPPTGSCGSAPAGWQAGNVSIACTASDSGSGLANPGQASFSLSTSVAAGSEDASASTGSVQVCDAVGNCATAGPVGGIEVDRKPPTVTVAGASSPVDGFVPAASTSSFPATVYTPTLVLSGSAVDSGSGVVTLNGAAFTGGAWTLPFTLQPGANTLTVTAVDAVGNTTTLSVTVTYAPDADGDGIANNIDGNSTVSPPAAQYLTPSYRFSDRPLGGTTSGQIVTPVPSGVSYTIADAPAPNGVTLTVSGPAGKRLRIQLDGKKTTYQFAAGTYTITDPAATSTVSVISGGPAELDLLVGLTTIPVIVQGGGTVSVSELPDGSFVILSVAGNVKVAGQPLAVGQALTTFMLSLSQLHLNNHNFELDGSFTLSAASNGIHPEVDGLTLQVGGATYHLGPGALTLNGAGDLDYNGQINGQTFHIRLRPRTGGSYLLNAEGSGSFTGSSLATVVLLLGDDLGSAAH